MNIFSLRHLLQSWRERALQPTAASCTYRRSGLRTVCRPICALTGNGRSAQLCWQFMRWRVVAENQNEFCGTFETKYVARQLYNVVMGRLKTRERTTQDQLAGVNNAGTFGIDRSDKFRSHFASVLVYCYLIFSMYNVTQKISRHTKKFCRCRYLIILYDFRCHHHVIS